jgi:hypothetical protein
MIAVPVPTLLSGASEEAVVDGVVHRSKGELLRDPTLVELTWMPWEPTEVGVEAEATAFMDELVRAEGRPPDASVERVSRPDGLVQIDERGTHPSGLLHRRRVLVGPAGAAMVTVLAWPGPAVGHRIPEHVLDGLEVGRALELSPPGAGSATPVESDPPPGADR